MDKKSPIVYFENLDCLRALAALGVILMHISSWLRFPNSKFYSTLELCLSLNGYGGRLGVYFFFVISGFLITYLMFLEQDSVGFFDIKKFYIRRTLRIWPLYFLVLIIGFIIYPFLTNLFMHENYTEKASCLMYSFFLVNYDHIYHPLPSNGILGVQWSIAIEEQFYLIWPVIFIFFNKNKFPILLILITVFSELFYMLHLNDWRRQYFDTLSVMRYLSFGALLAWVCYNKLHLVRSFFDKVPVVVICMIYLVSLLSPFIIRMFFGTSNLSDFFNSIIPMFFFGFVIVEQNYSNKSFFKLGRIKALNWLGKISYGLYLTHMIAIYMVNFLFSEIFPNKFMSLHILIVFVLTITLSSLSYTYFEKYFLKLKNKFKYEN
jgi:peptidoglycan/LPS O-acetylase OafA/YrhL